MKIRHSYFQLPCLKLNFTKIFLVSLLAIVSLACTVYSAEKFNHDDWSRVLAQFVDENGYVDYQGLYSNRALFDSYIQLIETIGPRSRADLFHSDADKLAYYINAYNALVFKAVLDRGPESKSVWRGLISGYSFFVKMKVRLDGEKTNLKNLEDDVIREQFNDPRIHAAINCASISCPRLRQHAFSGENLDQELDNAMTEFVNDPNHVRIDAATKIVFLSKIFDWFEEDFVDFEKSQNSEAATLLRYIGRYRDAEAMWDDDYRVKFLPYNKNINQQ